MLVDLHNRFESLLVEAKFQAGKRLTIVTVLAARVNKSSQMEPLAGILELSCEEVAASGIIDTSIVLWINFDTR